MLLRVLSRLYLGKYNVPTTIGGPDFKTRLFQEQIIKTIETREMAPAKTIINIYSEQRQIGKNNMISHLVANYGAVLVNGTSLEADKKKILDNYQLTDEQARTGSMTPFQQKPILIVSLASNDARLQEPKFYNNLEILSDGEWLLDGAWCTSPWIFVLGNDKLNPKPLPPAAAAGAGDGAGACVASKP